ATAKHYAGHSGPESERHRFDALADERDLQETYLPAFRATVVEGKVAAIMCAYNRMNGEPCCANRKLYDILRNQWGFTGHVVSDCGAVDDIYRIFVPVGKFSGNHCLAGVVIWPLVLPHSCSEPFSPFQAGAGIEFSQFSIMEGC